MYSLIFLMFHSNVCSVLILAKHSSFIAPQNLGRNLKPGRFMACVSADTVLPVKTISVKQAPLIVMPRYANKTWRDQQREQLK